MDKLCGQAIIAATGVIEPVLRRPMKDAVTLGVVGYAPDGLSTFMLHGLGKVILNHQSAQRGCDSPNLGNHVL
jgi:hypothetical protein